MVSVKQQVDIYGNMKSKYKQGGLSMGIDTVLILLGFIYVMIGRHTKSEKDKATFAGIGIGFSVSGLMVLLVNLIK